MTDTQPMTELAIKRLKSLAQGNNINPNSIELIESIEKTYSLQAGLQLTPSIDVKTKQGVGRTKNKKHRLLPSIEALNQEIEEARKTLTEGNEWFGLAYKELEETDGHGWGQDGASLFWDKDHSILAANDPCSTCNGTGQSSCTNCQGIGTVHCIHCEGRQMELCPLCHGHGQDPANPEVQCPQCYGEKYIHCRYCKSSGRMPCQQCAGKGNTPCQSCRGTGYHSQLVQLKKCASLAFKLGETRKVPSGLLRLVSRIGEDKLHRHADISMAAGSEKEGEDPTSIKLNAKIPYADVKLRLNGKACMVSVFGKHKRIAGVPLFLDAALGGARAKLQAAGRGLGKIDDVLDTRLMRNALTLILQGKKHPNALRRHYPFGLSPKVAKEIMGTMDLAVRNITRKTRLITGSIFAAAATGFFGGLFLTPLFTNITANWDPMLVYGILIALPIIAIGKCAAVLFYITRHVLQKSFKQAKISKNQPIGRVGYSLFGTIAVAYILILYLAKIIP